MLATSPTIGYFVGMFGQLHRERNEVVPSITTTSLQRYTLLQQLPGS